METSGQNANTWQQMLPCVHFTFLQSRPLKDSSTAIKTTEYEDNIKRVEFGGPKEVSQNSFLVEVQKYEYLHNKHSVEYKDKYL